MQTECSADLFGFTALDGRAVVAGFDGGKMTSDAGAMLLGATDRAIGWFAGCFKDHRAPDLIEHTRCPPWSGSGCSGWRWVRGAHPAAPHGSSPWAEGPRSGLAHTQFAQATCGTIRLKLLKIGALVRTSVRRITLAMPSAFPYQAEYRAAHAALTTMAN